MNANTGASRVDPSQIPRPQQSYSLSAFDTASTALPPAATSNYVARDLGNCTTTGGQRVTGTVIVGLINKKGVAIATDSSVFVITKKARKFYNGIYRNSYHKGTDGFTYVYSGEDVDKVVGLDNRCLVAWTGNYDYGLDLVHSKLLPAMNSSPDVPPVDLLRQILLELNNTDAAKDTHFCIGFRQNGRLFLATVTRPTLTSPWEGKYVGNSVCLGCGRQAAEEEVIRRYGGEGYAQREALSHFYVPELLLEQSESVVAAVIDNPEEVGVMGTVTSLLLPCKPRQTTKI